MADLVNFRNEKPDDVRNLFREARSRKERKMKYKLLGDLLSGKTINVTKNPQLFEALNKERMEFDELLKLHPQEAQDHVDYVKERKVEQGGKWWNPNSKAKWGEKGVIPPCCYHARPLEYWKNKKLVNNFFNMYPKFRIAEKPL